MSIKHWPTCERPREKLLSHGASHLSDAELLAIFLRTGCPGKSAVDLARDLLQRFGGLRGLLEAEQKLFCEARGLGQAKFAQLQAVLEMAKRHLAEQLVREHVFTNVDHVRSFLTAQLRHKGHEVFAALFLDNQHRLLQYRELFHGTIDGASVYPREVVKQVLQLNAAAVIFAHNHPSGVAEPSQADRHITQQLRDALALIDVRVLDHFVVGDGEITSFAERGWI
ncbi:JAB domain-containing protein [Saccharophagus sp. K07]|jgi:DNA repair protein RadC|uniref:RadC family protein n=1 Tax=Saccharophagus sp. K07 TaxID=2283636 RepID=UPI00165295E3|nr:DNA repair protein RadC [Saccharophagus sp. K07]MBC6906197.1 JAB domain-containing protein [Saccharophagus sp. K07]